MCAICRAEFRLRGIENTADARTLCKLCKQAVKKLK